MLASTSLNSEVVDTFADARDRDILNLAEEMEQDMEADKRLLGTWHVEISDFVLSFCCVLLLEKNSKNLQITYQIHLTSDLFGFNQFLAWRPTTKYADMSRFLQMVFNRIDVDKTGQLTLDQLVEAIRFG